MKKLLRKLFFPVMGIAALIWFLIRVIPKPSRASYPCVQAAAPIASSFVLYVLGLASSVMFFKKAKNYLYQARYVMFVMALVAGFVLSLSAYIFNNKGALASHGGITETPNQVIGNGVGIFPGRVSWIHNTDATNEECKNRFSDYWWDDNNTNQEVVDQMVSDAIQDLSGKASDREAWDAIFKYFNNSHNKGNVGYTAGEKMVIKVNLNCGSGNDGTNTSPHVIYSILNQLINIVGVAASDISIGDPAGSFDNEYMDKCYTSFPNVNYWGYGEDNVDIKRSENKVFFSSDGVVEDYLPKCYVEAAYMINIPVFKKHHRAGISLASKNHYGSFVPFSGSAFHLHYSMPCPDGGADVSNGSYGTYRVFVDIMGHKHLGDKTILYLIDGLWGSVNWGHPAIKWRMEPFNDDWPNSIFASQDPVAIESVAFDFLRTEFDEDHPTEGDYDFSDNSGPFPQYAGVDDYLHQAASSENWPSGLIYDPENDGTPLPESLGSHEHWNNANDKNYSRNLGRNEGIELSYNRVVSVADNQVTLSNGVLNLSQNCPNPFTFSTNIEYTLTTRAKLKIYVHNTQGKIIRILNTEIKDRGKYSINWDGMDAIGKKVPAGLYFIDFEAATNNRTCKKSIKTIKK